MEPVQPKREIMLIERAGAVSFLTRRRNNGID
jgi:hypothetical protein